MARSIERLAGCWLALVLASPASGAGPPEDHPLLERAVRAGDVPALERLLGRLDPDVRLPGGETPLRLAVLAGRPEAVLALLRAGADPLAEGGSGTSPLVLAVELDRIDLVRAMIEAGADPDAPTSLGHTALGRAVQGGREGVVAALLGTGAGVDVPTRGVTPLVLAVERGRMTPVVRALLAAGADPGARNEAGDSALAIAASTGQTAVCLQLLARGADREHVDRAGRSAADRAAERGHDRLAARLDPELTVEEAIRYGSARRRAAVPREERPFVITSASRLRDLYVRGELTDSRGYRWNVALIPGLVPPIEKGRDAFVNAGDFLDDLWTVAFRDRRAQEVEDGLEFAEDSIVENLTVQLPDDVARTTRRIRRNYEEAPFGWIPRILGHALWGYVVVPAGRLAMAPVGFAGGLTYATVAPVGQVLARPVGAATWAAGAGVAAPVVSIAAHQPIWLLAIPNREPDPSLDGRFGLEILARPDASTAARRRWGRGPRDVRAPSFSIR